MKRFIRNENIRHYRRLLETEPNEDRRATIRKLLAEEEAKIILPGSDEQDRHATRAGIDPDRHR